MNVSVLGVILAVIVDYTTASVGDRSKFFTNCVRKCKINQCEDDIQFIDPKTQPLHLQLLLWSCSDECEYECMWTTVEAFKNRGYVTPQFHGKWPFVRMLGIQEPASMVFSIMNLYANWRCLMRFRKEVRPGGPLYWLWHMYSFVALNGWFWSTVFHTRDFPKTEFLDYAFAFSMVLMSCYCMIIRFLKDVPRFIRITITVFFMAFFANHVAYLRMGRFDYTYNMQVNILVGTFTAICWFAWCTYHRFKQPYVWKCAAYVSLCGLAMLLEIVDRPPLFYTFDSHAIWHLSTAPLPYLWYSFVIDDCKHLRKHTQTGDDNGDAESERSKTK